MYGTLKGCVDLLLFSLKGYLRKSTYIQTGFAETTARRRGSIMPQSLISRFL